MTLTLPLSREGEPLFRQLYLGLRGAILAGSFRPGDQLPATRALAEQLGVSRTVVLLAYEQLVAEGFAEGRGGSGTYVAAGLAPARQAHHAGAAPPRLSRYGEAAAAAADAVTFPRSAARYDFAYGRGDVSDFPFEAWRRILSKHARSLSPRSLDYGDAGGDPGLREAIATHLRRARAVVCEPSQVIVVNGSQQALDLIARVLIDRGDAVAIEEPHYQGLRAVLRTAGAVLHPVRVDRDGLNPAELPAQARIAFVTPSHQFPTGAVLSLSRRLALLAWAVANDAVVVEDDYDGEFRYDGQPLESLQGLDAEGRVLYVGTFSRTIFSALRLGYLVVPKPLVKVFTSAKWLADRQTATLEQRTLAEFIASGLYERRLGRVRRSNALRREALLDAIAEHLPPHWTMTGDGAGAHLVLWPGREASEAELVAAAASRDVGVYGISGYFMGAPEPGLLLGYSRLNAAEIREGVRRLGEAVAGSSSAKVVSPN